MELLNNCFGEISGFSAAVLLLLLIAGVYYLSRKSSKRAKPSKYRKPFAEDARRSTKDALELDQKKRAQRLKQRFMPNAVPKDIDVIVIGSGIGGMATAAILAKTGRKCLVLEQHDQAGGCCHTFIEKGYEWDVGIHYVGDMDKSQFNRFLLDQLTEGQMDWSKMDDDYDNVVFVKSTNDKPEIDTIPIWSDRQKLVDELIARYPRNADGIREFFAQVTPSSDTMLFWVILKLIPFWIARWLVKLRNLHKSTAYFFNVFSKTTLQSSMDKLFGNNEELKTVLSYCWGDFGVEPANVGYGMLSALYSHYQNGGYYPVGGSSEIAYTMIPVIERAGGRVLINARVLEILLTPDKKRACGVRVDHSSGPVEIRAPIVVSSAGVLNTFCKMLPREIAAKSTLGKLVKSKKIKPSVGSFQVFIGLEGSQHELNLPAKNLWIYSDEARKRGLDKSLANWSKLSFDSAVSDGEFPVLFVGFPSAKDPTFSERFPGKSVATLVTFAPIAWFEEWESDPVKKRSQDYQSAKMNLGRRAWDVVVDIYPQLADRLDYIDASSPLTNNFYINATAGETYGLDHGVGRFSPEATVALRPEVPEIDNLYLTGQDILTAGFVGALKSGLLTSQEIMKKTGECCNLLDDAKCLFKDLKANYKL